MRLLEIKIEESCMIVNKNRTNSSNLRQWHPAFFADIQIELESEKENLIFENEHQLGTKPMEIDALTDWVFPEMGYTREQDKRALYEKDCPGVFRGN